MSGVSAFFWQAAVLLLVAYFLGAWIGCWLRRWISPPPKIAMESDLVSGGPASHPDGAAAITSGLAAAGASETTNRFSRALDGQGTSSGVSVTPQADAGPSSPAATAPPSVQPSPVVQPSAVVQPSVPGAGNVAGPAPAGRTALAGPTAIAGRQGLAGGSGQQSVASTATNPAPASSGPVEEKAAAPQPARAEPIVPADAPDRSLSKLNRPMTAAAAAAAALAAREAARPKGGETPAETAAPVSVAARMETLTPPARQPADPVIAPTLPIASTGSGVPSAVVAPVAVTAAPQASAGIITGDDLTLISGISQRDADALREDGITTFAAIAAWQAADVRRVTPLIGGDRRIARENWIEQAQLLKDKKETAYTRKGPVTLASTPSDLSPGQAGVTRSVGAGDGTNAAGATAPSAAMMAAAAAAAAVAASVPKDLVTTQKPATPQGQTAPTRPAVSERAAFARPRSPYREDLQRINGINSEVEQQLYDQGVTRLTQIADWSDTEQGRIDRLFGGMKRVQREDWVGQARTLSGFASSAAVAAETGAGGAQTDTTPREAQPTIGANAAGEIGETAGRDDAVGENAADIGDATRPLLEQNITPIGTTPAAGANVRGLRSVRSEALVGSRQRVPQEGGDDLKRIRGISLLIEKRLRAMGHATYEDIASWTQADIDRVSQQLDFRGRIEKESWVQQARILSSGGQS